MKGQIMGFGWETLLFIIGLLVAAIVFVLMGDVTGWNKLI